MSNRYHLASFDQRPIGYSRIVHEVSDPGDTVKNRLFQRGPDNFATQYGMEVYSGLNYAQAAAKYGENIMHQAACDGKLDNREKGER